MRVTSRRGSKLIVEPTNFPQTATPGVGPVFDRVGHVVTGFAGWFVGCGSGEVEEPVVAGVERAFFFVTGFARPTFIPRLRDESSAL